MTAQTITLARLQVLPHHPECACCASHLVEALRGRPGVTEAALDARALVLKVDTAVVAGAEAERLARDIGMSVARRYDHPVFVVEGMDCADCARTLERAVARHQGVHYAVVNFAAARLRLEYDREQTSTAAIVALAGRLGYRLGGADAHPSHQHAASVRVGSSACSADGTCCAAEPSAAAADQPASSGARPLVTRFASLVRERPKDSVTVICGLLIAAAWLGALSGAPPGATTALYVLATLAGGMFVARSGWVALRATRAIDINMLMTIAAIGALVIGEASEGAAVVFLFALGNALEGYTMDRARRSIRALMRLAPETALVLRPSTRNQAPSTDADYDTADSQCSSLGSTDEVAIPVAQVRIGEVIVIRPGDRVPLDALVLAGESAVNQAPITGESVPVAKSAGAELFAGSINGEGALEARVTRPANDSTLARIIHMVEEAQSRKSRAQRFIDVFARSYTPAVIVLAALVATLPPLIAGAAWGEWIYRALVLLVIACPCALVISTPVTIVSAISAAARAGVLFKGGAALEATGGLKAIVFDKTGTLTTGCPTVTDIIAFERDERRTINDEGSCADTRSSCVLRPASAQAASEEMLGLAAAVERRSTHPLARAVVAAAAARGLAIPAAIDFCSSSGRGARATIDGRTVTVGSRAMFGGVSPAVEAALQGLERQGRTAMLIGSNGRLLGVIGAADQPRAESRAAVMALKRRGIAHVAMLTGDAAAVAAQVGAAVGVDEVHAALLPAGKLAAVDALLERHGSVGMVGDGVNDAPALARATVGIAMGAAGSDVALETADVTLMADDLGKLPFAIGLSRSARRVLLQNIVFALAVKLVFLMATLLGVATLWMAVFADTGAALLVIANGMRLLHLSVRP